MQTTYDADTIRRIIEAERGKDQPSLRVTSIDVDANWGFAVRVAIIADAGGEQPTRVGLEFWQSADLTNEVIGISARQQVLAVWHRDQRTQKS